MVRRAPMGDSLPDAMVLLSYSNVNTNRHGRLPDSSAGPELTDASGLGEFTKALGIHQISH